MFYTDNLPSLEKQKEGVVITASLGVNKTNQFSVKIEGVSYEFTF